MPVTGPIEQSGKYEIQGMPGNFVFEHSRKINKTILVQEGMMRIKVKPSAR